MPETILVTGASGFVAAHVILAFLTAGYHVRGSVRLQSAAESIKSRYPQYSQQLSLVIVPDIAVPGAFNYALVSVSGVIHTASPFVLDVSDNENDLLQPAIRGTLNIAHTIHTCNPSVRRLVVTSSFAAVLNLDQGFRPTYRYSEADWNPCSYEIARKPPTRA
ncbi:NAD(P)-binding protein [Aspergillus brunneoviolaceus CBS 621.78]|uniref:NAD(P)-binding protein n=1 Tax=Aspergillus brunneoviolaceus CBS 621.78 TaxID=1450534 RepID=A0ACD1FSK5_9EURO|nr:NAD(P)-binding protein [Aspergillus brunneoviolaceus CBS 621.78]RAH39885.1 NAD(P)-binding protein [Aspergillus brunneoviolaceus CBS 621.78]